MSQKLRKQAIFNIKYILMVRPTYVEIQTSTTIIPLVGIATDYGLDGPGSNSDGDEIFFPFVLAAWSTQPPVYGYRIFPGVKCGRGTLLTTRPFLVPRSWKSSARLLPTLWATPSL